MKHQIKIIGKMVLAIYCFSANLSSKAQGINPDGHISAIYNLRSADEMDSAYKKLGVNFAKNDTSKAKQMDDLRTYIALAFAMRNDMAKAESYMQQLQRSEKKGGEYFRLARTFSLSNNWIMAEKYAKLAVDSSLTEIIKNKTSPVETTASSTLAAALLLEANVLEQQNKLDEAVASLSNSMGYCSAKNMPGLIQLKADILVKQGKFDDAMAIYQYLLKARAGGEAVIAKMKKVYGSLHAGNEQGFEDYIADVKLKIQQAFSDSIRTSSLHEKAPSFTLKNLEGNMVDLKDFEGKVVILDFWATWCVPCKASFPAMQMAVNKYATNKNVVFLFVDTWEYVASANEQIKSYLEKNKYTFSVLMDDKNNKTGEPEVVKKYGVTGVPAKFIIDKKGFIRYKFQGFSNTNEEAVKELSEMIDLASES